MSKWLLAIAFLILLAIFVVFIFCCLFINAVKDAECDNLIRIRKED